MGADRPRRSTRHHPSSRRPARPGAPTPLRARGHPGARASYERAARRAPRGSSATCAGAPLLGQRVQQSRRLHSHATARSHRPWQHAAWGPDAGHGATSTQHMQAPPGRPPPPPPAGSLGASLALERLGARWTGNRKDFDHVARRLLGVPDATRRSGTPSGAVTSDAQPVPASPGRRAAFGPTRRPGACRSRGPQGQYWAMAVAEDA